MSKVVFISGISSGFGMATASLFARNGYRVYGTIRSGPETLEGVNYLRMDLTDVDSIRSAVKQALDREGRIDILINNAGMHTGGPAETMPIEYGRLQIETNLMGVINLTREVLPSMREHREGKIINISSIGGMMGLPFQAFYSAAKFAIEGFSESIRLEVKRFGIKIVLINPGDFCTNNTNARKNYLSSYNDRDPYNVPFKKTLDIIEKNETRGLKPEILARKMLRIAATRNPKNRYIIAPPDQKFSVFLKRVLPGKWFDRIIMAYYGISG
jgi:NAD(P)-dependent dehydrogenase (short-subunit alcohol dehydrogenase family)